MNIEDLRKICLDLPFVTEDIKWENHLCFNIGGKMFLIAGLDSTPVTASFKTDDDDFARLSVQEGFKPAPYLARNKWVHTSDIGKLNKKEWTQLIKKSYEIIKSKLTKKILNSLA